LITGTYQQDIKFAWESDPPDPHLLLQDTLESPVFAPKETTTYRLEIENQGLIASASFTIWVNPIPQAKDFGGELSACRNQAGLIYMADHDTTGGEHFHWSLPDGGGSFDTLSNTNIAVVNWGNTAGTYRLALKTHNRYGCAPQAIEKTVTVTEEEAPEKAFVGWKAPDNMLYCTDPLIDSAEWGYFKREGNTLSDEQFFEDRHKWYCRLPKDHNFDPINNHYFVITYHNGLECGTRSFFNAPLDIPEVADGSILVYPNPTHGKLNISFGKLVGSQNATLQIFDIRGKIVYSDKYENLSGGSVITLSDVWFPEPGMYVLRMITDDDFFNSKIVVR
jgi:hypothetical protein